MFNVLFWRKLAIAFVVGLLGSLLPAVAGWGDSPNFRFDRAVLISLLAAAVAAGARAVLALGPINLVPSDAQHSVLKPKSKSKGKRKR